MTLFPLFIDLSQKNILVVGAGAVGSRKIKKLLPFKPRLTVVSLSVSEEIRSWQKEHLFEVNERKFDMVDLEGKDLVIITTENLEMQRLVYEKCQELKVPCNCVDSLKYCSFIFPALVVEGDVVVAVNTGGKAPGLSAFLRRKIMGFLPKNIKELQQIVERMRKDAIQQGLKTYSERAARIDEFLESKWIELGQTIPNSNQPLDPQSLSLVKKPREDF